MRLALIAAAVAMGIVEGATAQRALTNNQRELNAFELVRLAGDIAHVRRFGACELRSEIWQDALIDMTLRRMDEYQRHSVLPADREWAQGFWQGARAIAESEGRIAYSSRDEICAAIRDDRNLAMRLDDRIARCLVAPHEDCRHIAPPAALR